MEVARQPILDRYHVSWTVAFLLSAVQVQAQIGCVHMPRRKIRPSCLGVVLSMISKFLYMCMYVCTSLYNCICACIYVSGHCKLCSKNLVEMILAS